MNEELELIDIKVKEINEKALFCRKDSNEPLHKLISPLDKLK